MPAWTSLFILSSSKISPRLTNAATIITRMRTALPSRRRQSQTHPQPRSIVPSQRQRRTVRLATQQTRSEPKRRNISIQSMTTFTSNTTSLLRRSDGISCLFERFLVESFECFGIGAEFFDVPLYPVRCEEMVVWRFCALGQNVGVNGAVGKGSGCW